jgi:hypothetical protein
MEKTRKEPNYRCPRFKRSSAGSEYRDSPTWKHQRFDVRHSDGSHEIKVMSQGLTSPIA